MDIGLKLYEAMISLFSPETYNKVNMLYQSFPLFLSKAFKSFSTSLIIPPANIVIRYKSTKTIKILDLAKYAMLYFRQTDRQFLGGIILRVVKNPEERRGEILDTAEKLFADRGYANTTINDILAVIDIAKGTFYYYYKSKEEVMDAIITRSIAALIDEARSVADDEHLSVNEKLFRVLMLLKDDNSSAAEDRPNNAEMQQKSLVSLVRGLGPVIAEIIEQGKREELLTTKYPLESVEMLLVALKIIFDENIFSYDSGERTARARSFALMMESSLGAPEGSFNYVAEMLSGYPATE